jgi:RNA-binding protein Luc7-like 2
LRNIELILNRLGFLQIREKLIELEKTAGPRKKEMRSSKSSRSYDNGNDRRRYVGARELDGRSRLHRSKSRERKSRDDRKHESKSSRYEKRSRSPRKSRSRSRSRGHSSSYRRRDRSRDRR